MLQCCWSLIFSFIPIVAWFFSIFVHDISLSYFFLLRLLVVWAWLLFSLLPYKGSILSIYDIYIYTYIHMVCSCLLGQAVFVLVVWKRTVVFYWGQCDTCFCFNSRLKVKIKFCPTNNRSLSPTSNSVWCITS